MSYYGVDVTRPVELRPNGPDKRTQWAILKSDGFLHVITASVWRYDGGMEPRGTLNVHIGCSTLITDTVRDDESEWDAIRRVVATWQAEQREADHAEALAMVAERAAVRPVRRYVTKGSVSRAGRGGARQLGCGARDLVWYVEITNAVTMAEMASDGEITGVLRPGDVLMWSRMRIIPATVR